MDEAELEVWVPEHRRRPDLMSQEDWETFVRGMFPGFAAEDYEITQRGENSSVLQFDVSKKAGGIPHRVSIRGTELGENHCDCSAFQFGIYGTCSHIEFALAQLNEWYPESLTTVFEQQPYSEIVLSYGVERKVLFRPAHDVPRPVLAMARRCFDNNGELIFSRLPDLNKLIQYLPTYHHEMIVDEEVFEHIAWMSQQQWRKRDILSAFPRGANTKTFDTLLKSPLTSYQRETAINAAAAGRYLLFNVTGLGKRRTAIATVEILAKMANLKRVLILTQTETLQTWFRELGLSTERQAEVIFGSPPNRSRLYSGQAFYKIARYEDLKEDIGAILGQGPPDLLICDDAHTLSCRDIGITRWVRQLGSDYLLILSGVDPAKQSEHFLSLVDGIDSHRIGILSAYLNKHQIPSEEEAVVKNVNTHRIATTIPEHYCRDEPRMFLKNLPDIVEHYRFIPITEVQAKYHADMQAKLFRTIEPWKDDTTAPLTVMHQIQSVLSSMMKVAGDMILVDSHLWSGWKRSVVKTILTDHFFSEDVRAIIFCHEPAMFDSLGREFEEMEMDYAVVDRRMSAAQQKLSAQKFERNRRCRALLATDGIVEKLPIRQVHLLIHMDRPWNPEVLRERHQHLSRSSVRPLHAYHLISYGTIEHSLFKAMDQMDIKIPVDLSMNQSVLLLEPADRDKFFAQVKLVLKKLEEGPMVML